MPRTIIDLGNLFSSLWAHLLSNRDGEEEAAFLYADLEASSRDVVFHVRDWYAVHVDDFALRGREGIELTERCRAKLLKSAHERGTSLIECHSHPGPWPAAFSGTDIEGFGDFVPHVWWRLKGRPYAAIVVASDTLDAIAWIDRPNAAVPVDFVMDGDRPVFPTHESLTRWAVLHG